MSTKLTLTLPPDLAAHLRALAARRGLTLEYAVREQRGAYREQHVQDGASKAAAAPPRLRHRRARYLHPPLRTSAARAWPPDCTPSSDSRRPWSSCVGQ